MTLTLGKRLHAAFGFMTLLLLLAGGLGLYQATQAGYESETARHNVLDTAALADAQSALWALRWGVAQYVAVSDPAVRQKIAADAPKLRGDFERALADYAQSGPSGESAQKFEAARASFDKYANSRSRWLQLMGEGKSEEAQQERAQTTTPAGAATVKALGELIELQRKGSAADAAAAHARLVTWRIVLATVVALALACGVAMAFVITRSITRPVAEATAMAKAVAGGDLTCTLRVTRRDEIGALQQALAEMSAGLGQVVANVRSGVESMTTASSQIAAGNQDLSSRTEQQASSLQETASSLEQLTGTVKHSADNAQQANALARSASDAAGRGGEVVGQVVATMQDISASSQKISDIIGVIDGIAFQTNILALNAAVEAARAGEQGRGFAVVAGEVRTLAQRSAEAAKEIKTLIGNSVDKVEAGGRQVAEAGQAMGEIVTQVRKVTDLISEIAGASREQSDGIGQVSDAVTQMDQVTQQNAALVEESAAAAMSLAQQAKKLADAVSVFKLAPGASARAA
jgi:methyl-accepting chemotaxis protein